MKTKLLTIACSMLLACYVINSNAQSANRTLSNLISPTAVNQSLLPGTNNTINLGSGGRGALSWNNLYLGNALYLKGKITLHAPGTGNFFAGLNAGNISLIGGSNTGIGQSSLFKLTSGDHNTANSYQALYLNTTGYDNTAISTVTLYHNTYGDNNTAIGSAALNDNTIGYDNTAIGSLALFYNTTGYKNTANGNYSLYSSSGNYNTADGEEALVNNTTGNSNTALGFEADVLTVSFNATAIGSGAIVDASNKVRIGNAIVTSIEGQVSWTTPSDGRYKKDIKENVQGLAFINSLRPITYTVNVQGLNEYYNKGRKQLLNNKEDEALNAEMKKAEDEASKIVYNGFIAQEVEAAAKKLNYEFSGVDKPQNKDGLYGLRYDNFVVPLVKAVQELSQQNDELKNQNNDLQKRIERLETIINIGQSTTNNKQQTTNISVASLAQNIPNPFTNATTISYSLPSKFTTAQIIITDKNGKQLKQLNISGSGNGTVNIDASTLASGAYNYSLIVDGKIFSTKQMVLVK